MIAQPPSKDLREALDDSTLLPNGESGVLVTATDGAKMLKVKDFFDRDMMSTSKIQTLGFCVN